MHNCLFQSIARLPSLACAERSTGCPRIHKKCKCSQHDLAEIALAPNSNKCTVTVSKPMVWPNHLDESSKLGNGAISSIEFSVDRVKTRPSVSRTTGPSASLIRVQPMPLKTAISGTPPSLTDSSLRRLKRSALSLAVPPLFVPLHRALLSSRHHEDRRRQSRVRVSHVPQSAPQSQPGCDCLFE